MAWNDLAALLVVLALFGAVGWSMWAMWRPVLSNIEGPGAESVTPCPKCGQTDQGQTGEYPCEVCGLPWVWDDPSTSSGYDSEIAPDTESDSEATPKVEPLRIAEDDHTERG